MFLDSQHSRLGVPFPAATPARLLLIAVLVSAGCSDDADRKPTGASHAASANTGGSSEANADPKLSANKDATDARPGQKKGDADVDQTPEQEGVSVEQFQQSYTVNVDVKDQPARQLLADLLKPIGLTVGDAPDQAALDAPVTIMLSGVSRLQAVEHVCRQVKLTPQYPDVEPDFGGFGFGSDKGQDKEEKPVDVKPVNFQAGPRRLPAVFAGPCLVEVVEVDEKPPTTTGTVSIAIRAFNVPGPVAEATEKSAAFNMDDVVDSSGKSLQMPGGLAYQNVWRDGDLFVKLPMRLRSLLRDVEKIAAVRGRVKFHVPTDVRTIEFQSPKKGDRKTVGDVEFTVAESKQAGNQGSNSWNVHLEFKGEIASNEVEVVALDEKGKPLSTAGSGGFSVGGRGMRQMNVRGRPHSLTVKVLAAVEDLEYPFEVTDVPLEKFNEQPEELTPLEFAGHDAAVTAKVKDLKRGNFSKVQLQVANNSNKDVARLDFTFRYLEAAGKVLKTHDGIEAGWFDEPVVKKHSKAEVETTAFFMPEQTKDVRIKLKSVTFTDGTKWNALVRPLPDDVRFDPEKDDPVSIEVEHVSNDDFHRKVTLVVANRSERDATRLDFTLHYLDASGKELKTHDGNETADAENDETAVAPKRSRAEFVTVAFFMPEDATDVRATLKSVKFADGETWQAVKGE